MQPMTTWRMPRRTAASRAAPVKSPICTKQTGGRAGRARMTNFSVRPPVVRTIVSWPWAAATSIPWTTLARKAAVE